MPNSSNPATLANVTKAPMPQSLRPALATLSEDPPSNDPAWLYEIKFDGIRVLSIIKKGATHLFARSGRDITREYPELAGLTKSIKARDAILDGEVVVLNAQGHSDFQRLQSRFGVQDPSEKLQKETAPVLYLFDLLYCDGYDLRRTPLVERKRLLQKIVTPSVQIRISAYQAGRGTELFAAAMKQGLEGIIGKRADSSYAEGRTTNWLKFKGLQEIDGVIGGWTSPRGSREFFGSLLVGLYDENAELKFVGGVGTGYTRDVEKRIFEKLQKVATARCPFSPEPKTGEQAHWVKPVIVGRIGYAEWTSDRHLRQPRFLGLQPDRDPKQSTFMKEKMSKSGAGTPARGNAGDPARGSDAQNARATKPNAKAASARANTKTHVLLKATRSRGKRVHPRIGKVIAPKRGTGNRAGGAAQTGWSVPRGKEVESVLAALADKSNQDLQLTLAGKPLKLTHLDKIYFPKDGYTKRDVLVHYAAASPYLLPYLVDRPLVLHRYPNGIAAGAFYQKESGPSIPEWIRTVKIYSDSKRADVAYFLADDLASLLYLTNLGCMEQNPFSARFDDLETPDYMFIDLDPTEGTPFPRVVRAAQLLGKVLDETKLKWFAKTSGATGIHVFIPIERRYKFDQVRALLEIVTRIAVEREKNLLTRVFTVRDRPKNSVFVDVRQNAYAQSLASVFSIRPRDGAPVSTPVAPSELTPQLRPEQWNIRTVAKHLPARAKIWANFWKTRQTLEAALSALEKESAASI